MNKANKIRMKIIAAILTALSGLVSGMTMIGTPARLVHILTIFAVGAAFGASLTAVISELKQAKNGSGN